MLQRNLKGMILGAVIGTLVGSMSAFVATKQRKIIGMMNNPSKNWAEKAQGITRNVYENMRNLSEARRQNEAPTFIKGATFGALLGAISALLLTPKTGKQLRNNLTRKYQDVADSTYDIVQLMNNNSKVPAHKKKIIKHAAHKFQVSSKKKKPVKSAHR